MENDLLYNMVVNSQAHQLQKVLDCNFDTQKFGLQLSESDALELLENRKSSLLEQERLELGDGILSKLIFTFCDSPYIYQDNYVASIEALQELFYLYKSQSLEELTDDELLSYMKEHFDGDCQGSFDYLEENCLDKFCRDLRKGYNPFIKKEEEYEY